MSKLESWWKITFGNTYLAAWDFIYSERRTKKEIQFILKNLPLKKEAEILDIPCGQGRHSIGLAQHGFQVTGVDYSSILLKAAKERAKKAGTNLIFIKGDIRSIKYRKRFDAVINLGNSFGYFNDEDNERVIKNFAGSLKQDGFLVLDLPNTTGILRHITKAKKRQVRIPKGHITTEEIAFNPCTLTSQLKWTIVQNNKKKVLRGQLRFYVFSEIKNLLIKHGFRIQKIYGSFDNEKYDIESPRMLIIAKKYEEPHL